MSILRIEIDTETGAVAYETVTPKVSSMGRTAAGLTLGSVRERIDRLMNQMETCYSAREICFLLADIISQMDREWAYSLAPSPLPQTLPTIPPYQPFITPVTPGIGTAGPYIPPGGITICQGDTQGSVNAVNDATGWTDSPDYFPLGRP